MFAGLGHVKLTSCVRGLGEGAPDWHDLICHKWEPYNDKAQQPTRARRTRREGLALSVRLIAKAPRFS